MTTLSLLHKIRAALKTVIQLCSRLTAIIWQPIPSHVQPDDDFMDAMLAKVSLEGEEALTIEERNRMIEISKRKSNV